MKAQEKGAMPRIEKFLRVPNTAAGDANIEAAIGFLEDLSYPPPPGMKDWPSMRRDLKKSIMEDFRTLHKLWCGEVLDAYTRKRDDAERDFHVHVQAGGKREEWAPWKALGVLQLMDWYLMLVIANRFLQRDRDRQDTPPLNQIAERLLDSGEAAALKQFAGILCNGGSSVTASG